MSGGHRIQLSALYGASRSRQEPADRFAREQSQQLAATIELLSQGGLEISILSRLHAEMSVGKDFLGGYEGLEESSKARLLHSLGEARWAELKSLSQERDPEMFYRQLFDFWQRQGGAGDDEIRVAGMGLFLEPAASYVPTTLRSRAKQEQEAAFGQGAVGMRSEALLRSLVKNSTAPEMIVPMFGAGILGRAFQTASLGRLLGLSEATWYSRGIGAKALAAFSGLQAESLVFAWGHRFLQRDGSSGFGDEWRRAFLGISILKGGAALGTQARAILSPRPGIFRFAGEALPPLSVFLGLGLSARLDEKWNDLNPKSNSIIAVDSLATMLSLGVGMHLARSFLGPRMANLERELQAKADLGGRIPKVFAVRQPLVAGGAWNPGPKVAPSILMSESLQPRGGTRSLDSIGEAAISLRLPRRIFSSSGASYPFDLFPVTPEGLWKTEGVRWVGERIAIAERDGTKMNVLLEKHAVNPVGDPLTPEGALFLKFSLEEGDTRGKAFVYADKESITLFFIDLEETLITKGPPMRPGAGSIFFTWLAEQAKAEGKRFNVTRITSPQTVKIILKQKLMDLQRSRVEACNRIDPESYDEEYRVEGVFPLGDQGAWARFRRETEFYNVFGVHPQGKAEP